MLLNNIYVKLRKKVNSQASHRQHIELMASYATPTSPKGKSQATCEMNRFSLRHQARLCLQNRPFTFTSTGYLPLAISAHKLRRSPLHRRSSSPQANSNRGASSQPVAVTTRPAQEETNGSPRRTLRRGAHERSKTKLSDDGGAPLLFVVGASDIPCRRGEYTLSRLYISVQLKSPS